MNRQSILRCSLASLLFLMALLRPPLLQAGGPLMVGGPTFGVDGEPFRWNPAAMPIHYRVDGGPMAVNPSGTVIVNNTNGIQRVQNMFQTWASVPTAALSFQNDGPILSVGGFTDGDVSTAAEFDAVENSCFLAVQSPVVFDANGSITQALTGDPGVIGFSSICAVDPTNGFILTAESLLNGKFQDGVNSGSNFELTADQFNQTFVHEFGHFLGLDHSQINEQVLNEPSCRLDENAGLPVMFPILACTARVTAGLPPLAPDDMAWISKLYPQTVNSPPNQVPFNSVYTMVSGQVLFTDGSTPAQGADVIIRSVADPNAQVDNTLRIAFSSVSGYRFTGNPGQSVTFGYLPCSPASACPPGGLDDNSGGNITGSRDPAIIGLYEIPVPAGTYTVQAVSILDGFTAGSSVGPLDPPISLPGLSFPSAAFSASLGVPITGQDIVLSGTQPTLDGLESARLWLPPGEPACLRRAVSPEEGVAA